MNMKILKSYLILNSEFEFFINIKINFETKKNYQQKQPQGNA